MTVPGVCALVLSVLLCGCGHADAEETPIATVRHFLEVMDRSAVDESALREAYRLLDTQAQRSLAERADRASSLAGRRYEPYEMLAQGRFRLRFAPTAPGGMRERIDGTRAFVTVSGGGAGERAEVPLVHEQGRWRIVLALPSLRSDAKREG